MIAGFGMSLGIPKVTAGIKDIDIPALSFMTARGVRSEGSLPPHPSEGAKSPSALIDSLQEPVQIAGNGQYVSLGSSRLPRRLSGIPYRPAFPPCIEPPFLLPCVAYSHAQALQGDSPFHVNRLAAS